MLVQLIYIQQGQQRPCVQNLESFYDNFLLFSLLSRVEHDFAKTRIGKTKNFWFRCGPGTLAMLGTCPLWHDLFANFNLMWYTWISVNLVNVGKNLQLLWEISGMFHPLPDDVLEPLASVQPPLPLMCP